MDAFLFFGPLPVRGAVLSFPCSIAIGYDEGAVMLKVWLGCLCVVLTVARLLCT